MDKETFIEIWDSMCEWAVKSKQLYSHGIDIAKYDRIPYEIIIKLLSKHFGHEQVDLIIWSIYEEKPELEISEGRMVLINNAYDCWEYVTKLKEIQT